MKNSKKNPAPLTGAEIRMRLYVLHQMGKTVPEMAANWILPKYIYAKSFVKSENTASSREPSGYKIHVQIRQGKVIRADKPVLHPEESKTDL